MPSDAFTYINPSPLFSVDHGPLRGKSFIIQPNMSVRGWPTEAGSVALEGYVAIEDATVIERLKKAGATLVGSTRMSELGLGLRGDTTGIALTEGHIDLALMTDMMGEARVTASLVGAYAFKPTGGIVSRFGLIGLVPSMEVFGILTLNPADLVAAMDIISGHDDHDFSMCYDDSSGVDSPTERMEAIQTIGIVKECVETLDEEESGALLDGLDRLRSRGFDIREVSFPDFHLFRDVHHIVGSVEASSSCGKYDGVRYGHRTAKARNWNDMYIKSRCESFGLLMKTYLFQGAYFQFENYAAFENAARIRARMVKDANALFTMVDALAFPTRRRQFDHGAPSETIGDIYHDCALTMPANVMGLPSIQIPGFIIAESEDIGLQVTGPRMSDGRLLSLAVRLSSSWEGVG